MKHFFCFFLNTTYSCSTLRAGLIGLVGLLLSIQISGCASYSKARVILSDPSQPPQRSDDYRNKPAQLAFKAIDISSKIKQQHLQQKVDSVIILVDESSSMTRPFKGQVQQGKSRQHYLKQILQNFQNSIPVNLQFKQKLIMFGKGNKQNIHTKDSLAAALEYAGKTIMGSKQQTAVLILSEWQQINQASQDAAENLFTNINSSPCLHMIGIGNIHQDRRLFANNRCANAISAEQLSTPENMAAFVEQVFFMGPADNDEDGIYDYQDLCPNTLPGTIINWQGCPRDSRKSNPRYMIHYTNTNNNDLSEGK